ncbi:hypothetical protein WA026_015304 [Henosepilachna vigintioctopunctata]|uniref:Leucine-rich repeat-containing protein 51 n=1 Tax=Henosepilachna vigintioctopunctata TaxID=420089 RepID=A0AAW1TY36_9CUCU
MGKSTEFENVDLNSNERICLDTSLPADYSFQRLTALKAMGVEAARGIRIGSVPERGSTKKKLLTRSLWLNNNKLKNIQNLDAIVESVLEVPAQLSWLDFSFNYIKDIDESILKYTNLKIVYFHGNCISKFSEVIKLRKLKHLKTVTFHGNPISNVPLYRVSIMWMLPQEYVLRNNIENVITTNNIFYPVLK